MKLLIHGARQGFQNAGVFLLHGERAVVFCRGQEDRGGGAKLNQGFRFVIAHDEDAFRHFIEDLHILSLHEVVVDAQILHANRGVGHCLFFVRKGAADARRADHTDDYAVPNILFHGSDALSLQ